MSEAVAAILQSESACLNHGLPYLSHRGCTARSHHARWNYLLTNPQVNAQTFYVPLLQQSWAVLSSQPPSVQTFERYGQRFGGIEPHIKDYKFAAFDIIPSYLRDATALTSLLMLLDIATLIALVLGCLLVRCGQRQRLDSHPERGLSFLQLGLRYLQQLRHLGQPLPRFEPLPHRSPLPACASESKRNRLNYRIQFSEIATFSS